MHHSHKKKKASKAPGSFKSPMPEVIIVDNDKRPPRQQHKPQNNRKLSPISDFRAQHQYIPTTPRVKQKTSVNITNLVSSDEEEEDLEPMSHLRTPTSLPRRSIPQRPASQTTNWENGTEIEFGEDGNSDPIPNPKRSSEVSSKVKRKSTSSPNTPRADYFEGFAESADELALGPAKKGRKKRRTKKPQSEDIVGVLESAITVLDNFCSPEEVVSHITKSGVEDYTRFKQLKAACESIAKLLPSADSVVNDVPSTIHHYDKRILYIGEDKMAYVMQPVHVFALKKSTDRNNSWHPHTRNKTFGWIQCRDLLPLMYSFSGGKPCTEDHPQILDAVLWTRLVKKWADFYDQPFRTSVYDRDQGRGHCQATHVEPRLLLWFGCNMVQERLGYTDKTFEQLIGRIGELRRFNDIEAELIISHTNKKACKDCRKFHEHIMNESGMKITLGSCPTVGDLKIRRNSAGNNTVEKYAYDTEWERGSEIVDEEPGPKRRPVVEIVSKVVTTTRSSSMVSRPIPSPIVSQAPFRSATIQKAKEMKAKKAKKQSGRHAYVEEDEVDDDASYVASPQKHKKRKQH